MEYPIVVSSYSRNSKEINLYSNYYVGDEKIAN